MEESDLYSTDGSLSKSTTLSLSEFSNDHAFSSHDSLAETGSDDTPSKGKRKRRKKKTELIPPEEKLFKCEKRVRQYIDMKDNENAFNETLKLAPLVRLVYSEQDWKYADACIKLSKAYLDFRKLGPQAVKHAELAKSLILSCNTPQGSAEKNSFIRCIVEVYLCLGRSLTLVGEKYKEAENALLKSWQVLKSIKQSSIEMPLPSVNKHTDVSKKEIKLALADLYIATKQIDKAVSSLTYVVNMITEKGSDKDENLIPLYGKLAKTEKMKKKSSINYDTIVEFRLKAHEISSNCHDPNSIEVADTALALGRAYANIDSEQTQNAAETYFIEAQSAYKNCLGDEDPKTLKVGDELARVWMRTDREEKALKALEKSINVKAEVLGECSGEVANTHKLIGGVYLSQGEVVKAHKYLSKCLVIETELYGSQHWKTNSTRDTITVVQKHPAFAKSKEAKLKERPNFTSTIKSKR